ncbi:M48 family metallopeptidase [Paraburkholderia phytofirmans]|uniref:Peptidase M48 Ste24p n=1 Tax=Paraburkholderia phytofirmans (strain DSM 17436 / LMG 22146 / PsJN) TaxID=398527 RepID=B2T1M8_PARPJ|nr:M48 family metallopeptidase [Paraburkholderia phytofirmans]ACD14757.1 peptidase M48 Ste24p [Paraburkholderia phytofirmans PsJN]
MGAARSITSRRRAVKSSRVALHAICALGCVSLTLAAPLNAYAAAMPTAAPSAPAAAPAPATTSAPTAKPTATAAASPESATSAAQGANNAASAASTGSAAAATMPPSSPSSPQSTPPAPVTARTPAATFSPPAAAKAPAVPSMSAPASASYTPNTQLRYGGYLVFRNLIPSPMLEAQAADEFSQITYGAEHSNRLYADTDAHVTRVRSIVDKMIPYSLKWNERAKNWKWDVAVVRSPDIRMYCLPGGKIVVYGGLLDRARLNDNELGMLIGHEIAHALREHARERLGQLQASQLDSSGTIPQLFGLADLGAAPLGIGSRLLEMKYENTDETEADVIGSDIASRAGFDPRAAVTLWDKLAQATRGNRDQGFIYVHPYTPARRQDIIKRLPDMLPLYAKAIGKTVDALPDYAGMGRPRRKLAGD